MLSAAAAQPGVVCAHLARRCSLKLAHLYRFPVSAGDGSRAGPVLQDSVKAMLQLPDDHFLRAVDPLPSSLLAAASVILLSEPRVQRVHGQLRRSLTSHGTGPAAAATAAARHMSEAGETAMDSSDSQPVQLPSPSLPANVSSLVMGSPREQLHALRPMLRNLQAKLADLGGKGSSVSRIETCAA